MKIARTLFVVALVVGTSQVVSAQSGHKGHDHAGHDHAGHSHGGNGQSQAASGLSQRDQLRVAVQGICPMTGE
ncbi:MAG: hypothetical protein ACC628_25770, partial [Pirellulaceae bacterium]